MTLTAISPGGPVATHCPYCALQCGMRLQGTPQDVTLAGDAAFPVNKGALCIKGWTAGELLGHPERLLTPLVRNARGVLAPATWEQALDSIAAALCEAQRRYGRDAAGVFGSGSLTNEKAYLLGKFARVALGTANIDYNGRFCMSSGAAASRMALGLDRGMPFPIEDIAQADVVLLAGANPAETMPPLMQYLDAQRRRGGQLIVADPRETATAKGAAQHLRLIPGTDVALANGLLHILVREGLTDADYIEARTEGFAQVRALVASYWPERVERITGVPEAHLQRAAKTLGSAKTAMVLTARGAEQQSQGVNNALACINIALALGLAGKPYSGYGCITGQGNGQGGREHGQKADQLPGYRSISDPEARKHMAAVWGVPEAAIPGPGMSAYEMLDAMGMDGGVRAMLVFGSNIAVSAPNAAHIWQRLEALDFLAVADYFLSETAKYADVVLPSAQWAEEEGTTTNLEGRVILRRRVFAPPPGVRTDIEVLCALAERLAMGRHFSFASAKEVFEELRRATKGGPADYSGITYEKIEAQSGVFWPCPSEEHHGTPRLFTERFPTPSGKARFYAVRHQPPAEEPDGEYPLYLTTGRVLAQYQSGTQTHLVAELERMAPRPCAEVHPATAQRHGLTEGVPVRLATRRGSARFTVKLSPGIQRDTVFVPFHWGGAQTVNQLTNPALDPISRMPEFKVCAVRLDPGAAADEVGDGK